MKNIVLNLIPFNNRKEMTAPEFVIKKLLAFILIYIASVIIGEAVIIGALIAYFETNCLFTGAFWPAFVYNGAFVGLGELVVLFVLGLPLLRILPNSRFYSKLESY